MLEMFETGDTDRVPDVIASEYLDHQGLGGDPLRGPEGFVQVVAAVQEAFPDLEITVIGQVSDSHHIAAVLEWTTSSEGGTTTRRTLEWLTVRDGQAIEHRGARLRSR